MFVVQSIAMALGSSLPSIGSEEKSEVCERYCIVICSS